MSWLQYLTRSNPRRKSFLGIVLEAIPILFHIFLVVFLTYFLVMHNYDSPFLVFIAVFIDTQIVLNWFQFLRNKAFVTPTKGNFPGYVHRFPSMSSAAPSRGESTLEYERARRSWKECDSCDLHVPLRTHHCSLCRKCIFIPDHHCYFLGSCIGRSNQRFFIVFCCYAWIGSLLGCINLVYVMQFYRDFTTWEWLYYLLPFSTVMHVLGDVSRIELLYVTLIDFSVASIGITFFMAWSGMRSVLAGSTPYEIRKNVVLEDNANMATSDKFRQVFGPCGVMHFLFPFVPFEAPEVEHGYRRIISFGTSDHYTKDVI